MSISFTPRSASDAVPPPPSPTRSSPSLVAGVLSALARCLAALGLAGLMAYLWPAESLQQPPRKLLHTAELRLAPGHSVTLGRHALATPQADVEHALLWRDTDGRPWVRNLSSGRGLLAIEPNRSERPVRSLVLAVSQQWVVAGEPWTVLAVAPQLLLQGPSGQQWAYDGVSLSAAQADGRWQAQAAVCPDASTLSQWAPQLNQAVPRMLARPVPLRWGGQAACGQRLPHPQLWPDALRIDLSPAGFVLSGTAAAARQVCLDAACQRTLFEQAVPLDTLDKLVIGRTHFGVHWQPDTGLLQLRTLARGGWLPNDVGAPVLLPHALGSGLPLETASPVLSWQTEAVDLWAWPGQGLAQSLTGWALWTTAVLLAGVGLWWLCAAHLWVRWHVPRATTAGLLLGLAWAVLGAWGFVAASRWGAASALVLAGVSLLTLPGWPVRLGWAWLSLMLMAVMQTVGLSQQWQLGLQGVDAGAFGSVQRAAAVVTLCNGVMLAWATFVRHLANAVQGRSDWGFQPRRWPYEGALLLLAVLALVLMAAQALVGNELGVAGVQPVELAKAATVLWGGHALARRMAWQRAGGAWAAVQLWWRMGLPVLLFLAVVALALLLVKDWSPLLLMSGWLLAVTAAWAVARRSLLASLLLLLALAGVVAGVVWLHGPGLAWMQAHGFYAERFAVWLQLLLHPHSGEQVMRAVLTAAQGGWWGDPGVAPWRIPAVQSDMAPAFLLGRHGLAGGLALWAVQVGFSFCLLALGWRALCAVAPGDAQRTWAQRLVFFTAWGAAGMYTAHWLLAWGTNTSLTPVMGQPAPFLAVGNSVMLGFALPLHMVLLLQPLWAVGPRPRQD